MTDKDELPVEVKKWEQSTEYMLTKQNINTLMGIIIDSCFSRWNEKEMLIAQKIEDLVSGYVLGEMEKLYNERVFTKKQLKATRQQAKEEGAREERKNNEKMMQDLIWSLYEIGFFDGDMVKDLGEAIEQQFDQLTKPSVKEQE